MVTLVWTLGKQLRTSPKPWLQGTATREAMQDAKSLRQPHRAGRLWGPCHRTPRQNGRQVPLALWGENRQR